MLSEAQVTELGWTELMSKSISVSKIIGPCVSACHTRSLVIPLVDSGALCWTLDIQS